MNDKHKALSTLFRALAEHASDDKDKPTHLHHVRAWRVPAPTAALFDETGPIAFVDDPTAAPAKPDTIRFESTDGYALVRVDVPADYFDDAGFPAPDGFYNPKSAAALLGVGNAPIAVAAQIVEDEGWRWPMTDQVIPAETMAPGAACGFDPVLLASVLDTIAKIAHGFGCKKTDPARIQLGQASIDPCRITRKIVAWVDGDRYAVDVVAVVMPCRM